MVLVSLGAFDAEVGVATRSTLIPAPPFTVRVTAVQVTGEELAASTVVKLVEIFAVEIPVAVVVGTEVTATDEVAVTTGVLMEAEVATDETTGAPLTPTDLTLAVVGRLGAADRDICARAGVVDSAAVGTATLITAFAGVDAGVAALVTFWKVDLAIHVVSVFAILTTVVLAVVVRLLAVVVSLGVTHVVTSCDA